MTTNIDYKLYEDLEAEYEEKDRRQHETQPTRIRNPKEATSKPRRSWKKHQRELISEE